MSTLRAVSSADNASPSKLVIVETLRDATFVDTDVRNVIVRNPLTALVRREMGTIQCLIGPDCIVDLDPKVLVPSNVVIACHSVVKGDIGIEEGAVVESSMLTGAGVIPRGEFIRNKIAHGNARDFKISSRL